MKPRSTTSLLLSVVLFAGCPGGSAPTADGGDAAADGWSFDVPPPEPPEPPVLTPCPDGWREVPPAEPDGVTTCDPWPDGGPVVMTPCPPGWRAVPPIEPDGVTTCDPWPDGDPVAPPALTPCPAGWRELTDAETGTVTCDPWPETGYEVCAAVDEAHFPGEPGCTRIGTPCSPDDEWATDMPIDQPILYVLAGAPAGGDGSRAAPFATIEEAATRAARGTVIALGKGAFDEEIVLADGVTLWGACVAETVVTCSVPSDDAGTITVNGTDAAIRNLRVSGARPGVWIDGAWSLRLDDVVVSGTRNRGLRAAGTASVTARTLVVRDTLSRESDRGFGGAVAARSGARLDVARGVFERNRDIAVAAYDVGTAVALADVVVRDTRSRESDRQFGRAMSAHEGAGLDVVRAAFERNRDVAVTAFDPGTAVTLADVVVRDTQSRESDGAFGRGMSSQSGARMDVVRGTFERNRDVAVSAFDPGTAVTLTDVVVRDTDSRNDRTRGRGIAAWTGARFDVTRGAFERNRQAAVYAANSGTVVSLTDTALRDTLAQELDGTMGSGIWVQDGARIDAVRAVLERNHDLAVAVYDAGSVVTLTDVVVRDTQSREIDGQFGRAIEVQTGARIELRHGLLDRNREIAVAAGGAATTVLLADVVVRDTQSDDRDHLYGRGIRAAEGAQVDVSRVVFERNRDVAVVAFHVGTSVTLADVVIRDTETQEGDGLGGRAVSAQEGASIDVVRGILARNRDVAIFASGATTSITLADVVIRDTEAQDGDGLGGRAVSAQEGASIDVVRGILARNRDVAIFASGATTSITLTDVVTRDTLVQEAGGGGGGAVWAQEGARIEVGRGLFERNREVTVGVFDPDSAVTLADVVVRDTLAQAAGYFGHGVGAYAGGHVKMTRFVVSYSTRCGLQLAHGWDLETGLPFEQGGTMDLEEGVVEHNAICGANVQTVPFVLGDLMDRVIYRDNGMDLDSSEMSVPPPSAPATEL